MNIKIVKASFHRNGISGAGFTCILFEAPSETNDLMMATLFDDVGYCAVYSVPMLANQNIGFAMGNSWRGDFFEYDLREALKEYNKIDDNRVMGMFAVPDMK